MLRIFAIVLAAMLSIGATAQSKGGAGQQKFSPEKFRADMEAFIVREACLSPEEASKFFPLFDELERKQRDIHNKLKRINRVKPADERRCREAIVERDNLEIELKQLQQTYHNKMLSVISPCKLYDAIKAEDRFHRQMLRKYNRERGGKK